MDPIVFQMALGRFPADMIGTPFDCLVDLRDKEMFWAIDTVTSRHPVSGLCNPLVYWGTEEDEETKEMARAAVEKDSGQNQQGVS